MERKVVFTPLRAHLPQLVYLLGLTGLLGTTMLISFASDILSLLSLHVFVFYLMATSVFRWHLSMLGALFNIFRGALLHSYTPLGSVTYRGRKQVESSILYEIESSQQPTKSTSFSSAPYYSLSQLSSFRPCWHTISLSPPCAASFLRHWPHRLTYGNYRVVCVSSSSTPVWSRL
jgi:hypothetical protein